MSTKSMILLMELNWSISNIFLRSKAVTQAYYVSLLVTTEISLPFLSHEDKNLVGDQVPIVSR